MKKKISIIIILITLVTLGGVFYTVSQKPTSDEKKFKEEYESINNEKSSSGKEYRKLNIPKKNLIEYKTAEEIVEKIKNKDTFIVYFGFNTCPWCRSIIETLINTAKSHKVKTIYYVDVKEIRDVYSLNGDNIPVKEKEGSTGYNELLPLLKSVLSDYTLSTTSGDKTYTVGKRIYAPNVVSIKKGKAIKMETGISDKENNPYMKLTKEMLDDTKSAFEKVINSIK